jgi:hypothetical protein
MEGVNNDKNSYYLIYSPEKCRELTDLLSWISTKKNQAIFLDCYIAT